MASSQFYLPNSQQNEKIEFAMPTTGKYDKSNANDGSEDRSRRELLIRKELLDQIMSPTPYDSEKTRNFFPSECQNGVLNKSGNLCLRNDTKKRRQTNAANKSVTKDDGVAKSEIDLELRLSPSENAYNALFSSPTLRQNRPENPTPCLSYSIRKLKQEGFDFDFSDPKEAKVPSLVLMGCSNCYLYVMVPEIDPKCPKCEGCILIDLSGGNPR